MNTKRWLTSLALGLGLSLALLWLLRNPLSMLTLAQSGTGIIRAATTGADTPGCGSVAAPCRTVQYAVDQAAAGDEVHVATGDYTDLHARDSITQVVYISKTLTLRGGYTTAFTEPPDPAAHPTTLDAGGMGRGLVIHGPITVIVHGLRITNGDATDLGGGPDGWDAGGGVYVYTATATLNACLIYNNTASTADSYAYGGGVYLHYGVATLTDNTIQDNIAGAGSTGYGLGGGLALWYNPATLTSNIIQNNTAAVSNADRGEGGGIYVVRGQSAVISNNTISHNAAGPGGSGGGIYLVNSPVTLNDNQVLTNTANTSSAGSGRGGGLLLLNNSNATLNRNLVQGNLAGATGDGNGGGFFIDNSNAYLNANRVIGNTARNGSGGGILIVQNDSTLVNNVVARNIIAGSGSGAGVGVWSGTPHLLHTTVANNTGGDGAGIYVFAGSTTTLVNTILVSHTIGITIETASTADMQATLWYGNGMDSGGLGNIITGTVNIWGDPVFVAPTSGDYHIGSGSAAIDTGVNAGVTTDIDNQPRPQGAGYDIGADERGDESTPTPTSTPTNTATPTSTPPPPPPPTPTPSPTPSAYGVSQWQENGQPVAVFTKTQYGPALVSDDAGGAILSWTDYRNTPDGIYLYAQRLSSDGQWLWGTEGISVSASMGGGWEDHPMVSDGAGGAIVVWLDYRDISNGDDDHLYAQRLNANGQPLWAPGGVPLSAGNDYVYWLRTISDGQGGVIAIWEDDRNENGVPDIYTQRLDTNGNRLWGNNDLAVCTAADMQIRPELTSDGANGAIIAWIDDRNENTPIGPASIGDIYAQRVSAAGAVLWAADGVPVCTASNGQYFPRLAPDGNGGAIIAWMDSRTGYDYGHQDMYAQRIDANGAIQWTNNGVMLCDAPNDSWYHSLVSDGVGGAIVFWEDYRLGDRSAIYAQRVNASGATQWAEDGVAVGEGPDSYFYPMAVPDGRGGALVGWLLRTADEPGGMGLYAQRVTPNGAVFWEWGRGAFVSGWTVRPQAGRHREAIASSDGGIILAWDDTRNGDDDDDVYAQKVMELGPALWLAKTPSAFTVNPGAPLTYTLTYFNGMTDTVAASAFITDSLPAFTSFITCAGGQSCGPIGGVIRWSLGNVPTHTWGVVTLTLQASNIAPPGGRITNTAVLSSPAASAPAIASAQVQIASAHLVVIKHASPDPVQAGAQLTYTIRVTNTSSIALDGAVTDTLPIHVTPTGSQSWLLNNLVPSGVWSKTLVVTVEMGYAGWLTNVVWVATAQGASGIYTETSTVGPVGYSIYLPLVLRNASAH